MIVCMMYMDACMYVWINTCTSLDTYACICLYIRTTHTHTIITKHVMYGIYRHAYTQPALCYSPVKPEFPRNCDDFGTSFIYIYGEEGEKVIRRRGCKK